MTKFQQIAIFSIIMTIAYAQTYEINQKIPYCNIDTETIFWDRTYPCNHLNMRFNTLNTRSQKKKFAVLSKEHDMVSGQGIECKIVKHTKKMTMSFFGTAYTETETSFETVSKAECHMMSIAKQCRGNAMSCSNPSTCKFRPHIVADYKWFSTTTVTEYECHFESRLINAKNVNDNMFESPCKAKDTFCRLQDSIVVWNISVIHLCPFSKIIEMEFNYDAAYNIVFNKTEQLLFQLKPVEKHCDFEMFPTQEGFYLLEDKRNIVRKEHYRARSYLEHLAFYSISKLKYPLNSNDINELTLANMDFDHYSNLKQYATVKNQQCNNFITQLSIISGLNDVYTKIYVRDAGEIIVFSSRGNILIPKCLQVRSVRVPLKTNFCYKDLPVTFDLGKNITVNGFLTQSLVLTKHSEKIDCIEDENKGNIAMIANKRKRYVLENGNILVQYGNSVTVERRNNTMSILHRDIDIFNPNFHHSKLITDGVDMITNGIGNDPYFNEVVESSGPYLVAPNSNYITEHLSINMGIKAFVSELANTISTIILYIVSLFVLIVIIYCLVKYRKEVFRFFGTISNKSDVVNEEIELAYN